MSPAAASRTTTTSRTARGAGAALLLLLAFQGCGPGAPEIETPPAPAFSLARLDGAPIDLASFRGKLVLLDFWATWCPPCVLEVPELNSFYAAHRERGVELIAISVDEIPAHEIRDFATQHGVTYPVAIGSVELAEAYGAYGFPFHVLVSRDGRVLETLPPGLHDRAELAALVSRHDSSP